MTRHMRRNNDVVEIPERRILRERLWRGHVADVAAELFRAKRLDERVRVDEGAARQIRKERAGFDSGETFRVEDAARFRIQRKREKNNVRDGEEIVQPVGAPKFGDLRRFVLWKEINRYDLSSKGRDNLRETTTDSAETNDPDRFADEIEGRFSFERAGEGGIQGFL